MIKWHHITFYWTCNYVSMLGLKLIYVSKRGHRSDFKSTRCNWHLTQFININGRLRIPRCTHPTFSIIARERITINTMRPEQNGRNFADHISNLIENYILRKHNCHNIWLNACVDTSWVTVAKCRASINTYYEYALDLVWLSTYLIQTLSVISLSIITGYCTQHCND